MRSMKDLYRKIMKVALIFAGLFAFFFLINLFYLVTNGAFDVAGNSFSISDEYLMARFNFWFSGSLIIAFILLARIMHDLVEKRGKLVDAESYKRAMRAKKASAVSKTDFVKKSDEIDKIKDTTTLIARRKKEKEETKRVKDIQKAEKAAKREDDRLEKDARKAEEAKVREEQRLIKEEQKAEEARIKEEQKAEEARIKEEQKAEEARIKEEQRIEVEAKKAEEAKLAEEQRIEDEANKVEDTVEESVEETTVEPEVIPTEQAIEKIEEEHIVVPVVVAKKQPEIEKEEQPKPKPVKRKVVTRTKTDIIALINDTTDVSKNKANKFLKAFADVVKDTLTERNDVVLKELGTFTTIEMPAKDAVNPQTKQKIVVPAHHQVRFRISSDFKDYFDEEIIKREDPEEQARLDAEILEQDRVADEQKAKNEAERVERARLAEEQKAKDEAQNIENARLEEAKKIENEANRQEQEKIVEQPKNEPKVIVPVVIPVKSKKTKTPQKTKADFINMMEETTDLSKNKANKFLKAFAEVIKDSLVIREDVKLDEIGTFTTILMPAKDAVNPQTHQKIVVPAHHQVRFRISDELKEIFDNLPTDNEPLVVSEPILEPKIEKVIKQEPVIEKIVEEKIVEPVVEKPAKKPIIEKEPINETKEPAKSAKNVVVTKTKADFINIIVDDSDISKNKASKFLKAFASTIKDALTARDDVDLPGFGTFTTIEMPAKDAVNPQTHEKIVVPAHHQVRFRIDSDFKDKFN